MGIDDYNFLEEDEFITDDTNGSLYVVYLKHLGVDINGQNLYHLYLSNNPDETFAEGWGEVPACNTPRQLLDLDEKMYSNVMECKTDIKLDLAQDCCCFSMQDARDHIVALAYENLDNAEEYPEPRIIIQFGDSVENIETLFAKRNIILNKRVTLVFIFYRQVMAKSITVPPSFRATDFQNRQVLPSSI